MRRRPPHRIVVCSLVALFLFHKECLLPGTFRYVDAVILKDGDYDEFVQEVLEEDAWHHDEQDNPYREDPPPGNADGGPQGDTKGEKYEERLRRKREEERLKQQAEEERLQRQAVEDAFARELESLPEEQQKLLRQKRRKDGKIVQRILSAYQRHDYYAVLGLRWFFPEGITLIRGRGDQDDTASKETRRFNLKEAILRLKWPALIILRISNREIQQANRKRAVQVHPDKNRDPRTEQAFVAVQDAFSVLSDPVLRRKYEVERRQHRIAIRQAWKDRYYTILNKTVRPLWTILHKFWVPLSVPIVVLAAIVF